MTWGRGPFTAVVTPAAGKDAFGDPMASDGTGSWTVPNCKLAPRGSKEDNFQASRTTSEFDLFAPPGASFPEDAHVAVAGIVAKVQGQAQSWRRGGQCGQVVALEQVKG